MNTMYNSLYILHHTVHLHVDNNSFSWFTGSRKKGWLIHEDVFPVLHYGPFFIKTPFCTARALYQGYISCPYIHFYHHKEAFWSVLYFCTNYPSPWGFLRHTQGIVPPYVNHIVTFSTQKLYWLLPQLDINGSGLGNMSINLGIFAS
jgi:hypothetical protein